MSTQFGRSAELSARDFNLRVSDPELFSGGGSVAALVASNACALTLLVVRLAARRRVNAAFQPAFAAALARIKELTESFYTAADLDLVVLDRLLAAQRALKQGAHRSEYVLALLDAARSPLELAERCAELVALIDRQTLSASRFTVSDLGAAAALATGACKAALLTVDVNLALLRDEPGCEQAMLEPLAARAAEACTVVTELGSKIEAAAAAAIANTRHA